MTNLNNLFGNDNTDSERITNLIVELNALDINFDVRFINDMEIALILDDIYKIADYLKLENAKKELNKISKETKLLTFNKKRNDLFNSESTELNILSVGLGETVNLSELAKKVFGWDKIKDKDRYEGKNRI